jgi:saccharopine dehydrogenase-like NADP-dependent oxidoreductase
MRVTVLGAGRVGAAIAFDLASDSRFEVTVADASEEALAEVGRHGAVRTRRADLGHRSQLDELIGSSDLVVGALPSILGHSMLESAVACGTDCVDVSFHEEDPLLLDQAARHAGVTIVVDCGLAPGLSSLILGHCIDRLETVERFVCHVGGLPENPQAPWMYKAPFSPCDVLAEYTRPARYRVAGRDVIEAALSGREELEFENVGRLEAFNTDGLRTLLTTVPVPDMVEKTLRYPGHAAKIKLLREIGLLSSEPISVDGVSVAPLAVTSKLLFEQWRFTPGEPDVTVMRVDIEGVGRSGRERRRFELFDRYDPETGISSMARTTGFTCAAVARIVAERMFRHPGVSAPEHVGMRPDCYERVVEDLAARGVRLRRE